MKRIVAIYIVICVIYIKSIAQEKDSIIYILPDKIEVKLDSLIAEGKEYDESISFRLIRMGEDEFMIIPGSYRKEDVFSSFTNRFVLINKTKYPVTFDYDEIFSTVDPHNTGEFSKREGYIKKGITIFEGYSLTFDRRGNIIDENWGLYAK